MTTKKFLVLNLVFLFTFGMMACEESEPTEKSLGQISRSISLVGCQVQSTNCFTDCIQTPDATDCIAACREANDACLDGIRDEDGNINIIDPPNITASADCVLDARECRDEKDRSECRAEFEICMEGNLGDLDVDIELPDLPNPTEVSECIASAQDCLEVEDADVSECEEEFVSCLEESAGELPDLLPEEGITECLTEALECESADDDSVDCSAVFEGCIDELDIGGDLPEFPLPDGIIGCAEAAEDCYSMDNDASQCLEEFAACAEENFDDLIDNLPEPPELPEPILVGDCLTAAQECGSNEEMTREECREAFATCMEEQIAEILPEPEDNPDGNISCTRQSFQCMQDALGNRELSIRDCGEQLQACMGENTPDLFPTDLGDLLPF